MNNKHMRLSALLLVLVLITSCFVGGSLAKYIRTDSGTDSARAAKWGVTITPNGNMFAKEYVTHDPTQMQTFAKSVISTDNVVAPGTNGALASVELGGTPEVLTAVSYTSTLTLANWTAPATGNEPTTPATGHWEPDGNGWVDKMTIVGSGTDVQPNYTPTAAGAPDGTNAGETWKVTDTTSGPDGATLWEYTFVWEIDTASTAPSVGTPVFYCPVEITVGTTTFKGVNYTSAADFAQAVQRAINAYSGQYAPGTDLSTVPVPEVTWKWAYDGNDDVKDTYLGDQAAAGNAATIELTIETQAMQLD